MLAIVAFESSPAHAQLVRVSPGPLSQSHKDWDGASDCFKCHTKGGDTLDCFGCHAHKPLKKAIAAGRGLHAKTNEPCKNCHQEHKGRSNQIADWSSFGGRASFRHERTGFSLAGLHEKVKCGSCHKRKTARGRTTFPGLSPECGSCHENPHDFSDAKLNKQCSQCHTGSGAAPARMRPSDVKFDHKAQAGVELVGKHAKAKCVDCHKDGQMKLPRAQTTCAGCHENPHGKEYGKRQCGSCHSPARPYKNVRFDHKKTEFPLERRHKRVDCKTCHERKPAEVTAECTSCHDDEHNGRFSKLRCSQCHADGSWRASRFQHNRLTKFRLEGKHAKATCRNCHRGGTATRFERHTDTTCQNCHTHKRAHRGQFADRSCLDCHPKGGSRKLDFDHNRDTQFPLVGKHERLANKKSCRSCHTKKNYQTTKTRCADCHKDPHEGSRGNACEDCHTVEADFGEARFDHRQQTGFPLVGLHKELTCGKCHPTENGKRVFAIGKRACADCHADDDPHRGKLGKKCETCHRVEKGAPKFRHDSMTSFALTGAHAAARCSSCHRKPPADGPPQVGWTRAEAPRALDKRFPVMGTTCRNCHADNHEGRYGANCQSCHRTSSFGDVSATIHDTGSFALRGVHNRIACGDCHQTGRMLGGLGEQCQTCHWDDDRHRNALGPNCGDCHRQLDWRATKFSHVQTGFALRGAHRTAPCEGCHGVGTYQGTPTDCDTCHLRDAQAVSEPIHTAELQQCDRCHREIGFVPARLDHQAFRLVGQHRFVRCRNCHSGGSYAGTPSDCANCHSAEYNDPRNQPDHRNAGFPTTCADCHTPVSWRPASQR